ncbi:MAG: MBL fold metallo-hydrolase [Candidatus Cloacimonas sp.]|jgi:competence protein ComEC|nr:MBL fold metallo-hydrolase [Candidatus Cloacimonas sp.]
MVSIAICPITLYYFGRASLNGIIGNLGGIPLITMLLPLSGLILMLPRGFYLSHALKLSYEALVWLWQVWFKFCANLPFSLRGDYLSRSMALAMAVTIIWMLVLVRGKFRLALKLFLPCCIIAGSMYYFPLQKARTTEVHIFSCAVADCSLIRFESGKTLMIDTGGGRGFTFSSNVPTEKKLLLDSWMQKSMLSWLSRTGINKIDYLVLSHLHADHYGGLLSLLQSNGVEHLFVSQATTQQPLWQFFTSVPYFKPTTIHVIADTCSFWLGEAKLTFLHPGKGFVTKDENERSLVCRLDTEDKRILFTGDIGIPSEQYMLNNYPEQLACDYLKVPHHGSRYSSTQEFLAACKPQEAWVCTSARNHFGFPHAETIERYHTANVRFRSTADGSIRIKIDRHSTMKRLRSTKE